MNFQSRLNFISKKNKSLLCIGLDTDFNKIPLFIRKRDKPQFEFNKAIIDATSDFVCAYKPNIAFYEAQGPEGLVSLKNTIDYLKSSYKDIPIILDAKRADIGNTNTGYVKYVFDYYGADAVTLHPYLGGESLKPFLERKEKGIFILCRTSNPGAGEFQDLTFLGKKLFEIVAQKVSSDWNSSGNCGIVVGATYPAELDIVRHIVGNMPILIPGIGAQGGDVEKTVKAGVDNDGGNAIINSSRGIIFASEGDDFALAAQKEAKKLKDEINLYRKN